MHACFVLPAVLPAVLAAVLLLQAKPRVKLHMLGETVDGHDLDVLQVRVFLRGRFRCEGLVKLCCRAHPVWNL